MNQGMEMFVSAIEAPALTIKAHASVQRHPPQLQRCQPLCRGASLYTRLDEVHNRAHALSVIKHTPVRLGVHLFTSGKHTSVTNL